MSNLKFHHLLVCSIFSVFSSTLAVAENPNSNYPFDFYLSAGAGQSDFELNDDDGTEININIAKMKAGLFIQENIALEFSLGQGLQEKKLENINAHFEVDSWQAVMLRLQSPHLNGFRIYVQGGYSEVEVSQTDDLTSLTIEDTLNGATWSLGAEQKISKNLPFWFYLDFSRINDDIRINIIDAGFRLGLE